MIWQFFDAARRSVLRSREAVGHGHLSQEVAVSIFLAVTTVETFLNVFFRIVVEEDGYRQHKEQLLRDLSHPFLSLDKKIKTWPERILGRPIDLNTGAGKAFMDLKDLRNGLMHFRSTHSTLDLPDFSIEGLPDTSTFDELTSAHAESALATAEQFLTEVFLEKGLSMQEVSQTLHLWTGRGQGQRGRQDYP
jgi:hypothetical protein